MVRLLGLLYLTPKQILTKFEMPWGSDRLETCRENPVCSELASKLLDEFYGDDYGLD